MAKKKAAKRPVYRLKDPTDEQMTPPQRALREAISSGPRGIRKKLTGPFAIWMQAPEYGDHAQRLGAHVRYNTALSPRQSEFAILCTGQKWKAQYEWFAHEPMALKAGVKPATIKDIKAGRLPKGAPKDERAIYEFVAELYKTRRVSDKTYKRVTRARHRGTVGWSASRLLHADPMTLNVPAEFQPMRRCRSRTGLTPSRLREVP